MELLQKARDLVRGYDLDDDVLDIEEGIYWNGVGTMYADDDPLTTDQLAKSLHYHITLDTEDIADEATVELGTSKYKGLPHLPSDMDWPDDMFFLAQFNLAELAKVDKSGRLPKSGMLYLFFNGSGDDEVVFWEGPTQELEVREYPEDLPDAEYYLDEFLGASATITFAPHWIFYVNDGDIYDYKEFHHRLPEELVGDLSALLGCGPDEWDAGTRLYGRPHYWQGEDEYMDEDDEAPELLLFQDEFGEGTVHFWSTAEEIVNGDFDSCWVSYSGT